MPHATLPNPGLQALILCGPGVSLNTFTSTPKDFPKALVPIANRPMVWYPLDWCHRMGISNVTIASPAESAGPLEAALATHPALTSLPSPKVIAPEALTQTTGTGEILRLPEIQKWITTDFIVLPCDLISEIDGSRFVQQWMTLNPPATASSKIPLKIGFGVFYPTYGIEGISHKKDETDFIATTALSKAPVQTTLSSPLRTNIEQLVMCMPTDTLNDKISENHGFLRVRQSLLNHHGRVKLKMKYRDAHIYIFPKWVKEFVAQNDRFDSISEDVLGWWAKAQWQDGLPAKLGLDQILVGGKTMEESLDGFPEEEDDIDPALLSSSKALPVVESSTAEFASRVRMHNTIAPQDVHVPPLLTYVQPAPTMTEPQPLIRRIDTTHQLLTVSLYLAKLPAGHQLAHDNKVHPTAQLGLNSRVSNEDSLVGENVQIGMQCTVKESVIGANCEIGSKVKLTRCLLMEGVHIGDGAQLTGCIIGRRAKIQGMRATDQTPSADAVSGAKSKGKKKLTTGDDEDERTRLTDCEVAPNYIVEAGTEAKGEKFMAFDTEGDFDEFNNDDDDDDLEDDE